MTQGFTNTYQDKSWNGIYVGVVKDTKDSQFSGRIYVWIPEMGSDPDDKNGWKLLNYCSPFAGASDPAATSQTNIKTSENTQTSYGFWGVVPDVGNQVLCAFASGRAERGFWFGCIFQSFMNHMVPGVASGDNYKMRDLYPNNKEKWEKVPVAEYNKHTPIPPNPSTESKTVRPALKSRTEGIGKQGLLKDSIRGTNTSSSRRESPSQVFGILTPGPKNSKGGRDGGHSFVMDDGNGSEYIGFTTKNGSKIKIDDSNGLIYAINRDGTSWIQMDADGHVDIFGAASISLRSQQDVNIRADNNVSIEAGKNIILKAAKDTNANNEVVGEGTGLGGDIYIQALNDQHTNITNSKFTTIESGDDNYIIQTGSVKRRVATDVQDDIGENHVKKVGGNLEIDVSGHHRERITSDFSITASNIIIDPSGNVKFNATLETGSDIVSSGNIKASMMYASDFKAGSIGLVSHTHDVAGVQPGSATITSLPGASGGGSGGSASVSSITTSTPIQPTDTTVVEPVDKVNVLRDFNDVGVWLDRKTQQVKTVISRYPTFEPCRDHIKK